MRRKPCVADDRDGQRYGSLRPSGRGVKVVTGNTRIRNGGFLKRNNRGFPTREKVKNEKNRTSHIRGNPRYCSGGIIVALRGNVLLRFVRVVLFRDTFRDIRRNNGVIAALRGDFRAKIHIRLIRNHHEILQDRQWNLDRD